VACAEAVGFVLAVVLIMLIGCHRAKTFNQGTSLTGRAMPAAAGQTDGSRSDQAPSNNTLDAQASCAADRQADREHLVEAIEANGIKDARVLASMRRVPRHRFVPEHLSESAYDDRPLSIGHGQTISQPYVVAAMTAAARPKDTDRCLEIGTGSGYQAAVLAELCSHTYSIEYLPDVARFGESNLRKCGYDERRVSLAIGDGYQGWPDMAPFDVIIVTAAPEHVPQPLLGQLAQGGRLVIPVGPQHTGQDLELWTRVGSGTTPQDFRKEKLMDVLFVPMVGRAQLG
jgi:protein-L-isoaspartate(D-aspartate) O-methyltransferase